MNLVRRSVTEKGRRIEKSKIEGEKRSGYVGEPEPTKGGDYDIRLNVLVPLP
jgi:hypothetical protein